MKAGRRRRAGFHLGGQDKSVTTGERSAPTSAWAPLRVRAFRALWTAQLFSMIGTWMQTVGAQWLLVDEPNAATLVGLVQAAAMLPTLVLALPSGALADIVDRRKLLVAVQVFQVIVGAGLTVLTATGLLTPALLLTATFLLGVGTTLTIPAYQVLVQELVGRDQMRSATRTQWCRHEPGSRGRTRNRRTAGCADRRGCGVRPERVELPGAGGDPAHHASTGRGGASAATGRRMVSRIAPSAR